MHDVTFLPPQNLEAEQSVLGSLIYDGKCLRRVLGILDREDFYKLSHGEIYGAVLAVHKKGDPVDIQTITDHLRTGDRLDGVGGLSYLHTVTNSIVTTANIVYHARIVKEQSQKRQLLGTCRKTIESLNHSTLDELITSLRNETSGLLRGHGGEIVSMKQIAAEVQEYVERRSNARHEISGVPSGFEDIDRMTDGFQKGDLIIIAGRPGMGKSAFAMAIAQNSAVPAGVISLEMGKYQLGIRTVASLSGVELFRLRKGLLDKEHWQPVVAATGRMAEMPIYFSFSVRNSAEIEKVITQMVESKGIELLIIDYLQLAKSTTAKTREQEVAEISRLLKTMAQIHNIPVIALAQLNRAVESRENKRPMLADLRDSGQIEQDADVIIFLFREDVKASKGIVELNFAKGRNIGLGIVKLSWDGDTMTFNGR